MYAINRIHRMVHICTHFWTNSSYRLLSGRKNGGIYVLYCGQSDCAFYYQELAIGMYMYPFIDLVSIHGIIMNQRQVGMCALLWADCVHMFLVSN